MDLREMGCEDGRWMELAQDRVQLWALILAALDLWVLVFHKTELQWDCRTMLLPFSIFEWCCVMEGQTEPRLLIEVLMALATKIIIFCDVMLCNLAYVYRRFGSRSYIHLDSSTSRICHLPDYTVSHSRRQWSQQPFRLFHNKNVY
jgi:hypothetical protein